jgi:lipopolysaccharide export system permease protein
MSRTLTLYVLRLYATYFLAMLAIVLAVFVVADFSDRVKLFMAYTLLDVGEMYWNKSLVAIHLLAPPAMMLAAGAAIATLSKRGEITAMRALTFGPGALYLPIGGAALITAGLLLAFDETVVTKAGARVDDLSVTRFNSGWKAWYSYYRPTQWFRRGDEVLYIGGGDAQAGFQSVSIYRLSTDFRLVSRIDAERMSWIAADDWQLTNATIRTFPLDADVTLEELPSTRITIGFPRKVLVVQSGRPEYLARAALLEQIRARREIGQPVEKHLLALHNRYAYPLTGLAATLLALGLGLRPGRKGQLTSALVEGFAIAVAMWAMMVVGKGLALAGHLPIAAAAWVPCVMLAMIAAGLWLKRNGLIGQGG